MASKLAILWPVFALAAWTAGMLVLIAIKRVSAGLRGSVHPREHALGESAKVPIAVSLPNRNYMNLLELPVLFYIACILAYVTNAPIAVLVPFAWLYVGLRVIHSAIHVTYNNVMHRFAAFAASNGVLIVIWALLWRALQSAA